MKTQTTEKNWIPLIELIPAIERTENFGEYIEATKISENFSIYNGFNNSRIVDEFSHRAYDNGLIYNFDWMGWDFGKSILENKSIVSYENYDIETLNKFIIAIVRNDKYCDGYLISKFSDGTVLSILKSADSIIRNNRPTTFSLESIAKKLNNVSNVFFIKLGKGNEFAKECIENNYIKLDYRTVNHELCMIQDWEAVKDYFIQIEKTKKQVATNHTNQIKQFYTADEDTLWITFNDNKLLWCFAHSEITPHNDNTKTRPVVGRWFDIDVKGNSLLTSNLSGNLLKTHGFQGTICNVSENEYLISKLKGEEKQEIKEVKIALNQLRDKLASLIRHIQWQDFEILIDLIFRQMGWQRVSVLGKDLKTLDLELVSPVIGERAVVQIKTGADLKSYKDYLERFESMQEYDKFFFIVSAPEKDLINYDNSKDKIKLYLTDDVASLVISAGLTNWVINKTI